MSQPPPTQRLPALDGLRGLAILSVLAWHYVACIAPWDAPWGQTARRVLTYAWSGVDLFFVLSGFLIGGIVLDNRRAANFITVFYARRALRILPLYWLLLVAFAASSALLAGRISAGADEWLHGNPQSLFTYLTFGQNIATGFFSPQVAEPGWLNVTWSLAVEEHFYLVVPLALVLLPRKVIPWALGAIVMAGPLVRWGLVTSGDASVYILTPARVDTLVLGVLCAWALRQPGLRAALTAPRLVAIAGVLGAILVGVQLVDVGVAFPVLAYSALGLFHACLLLLAVTHERGRFAALLRVRALQRTGLLAYGLYLFHQPVNGLAHALLLDAAPALSGWAAALVTCAALAATFALAEVSWRVVERPLIGIGQRLRYAREAAAPYVTPRAPAAAPRPRPRCAAP
jgi:peptidoglycan/LPS O-acetylase OafA/YrhL